MRRLLISFLLPLLVVCLMVAAATGSYLRMAHAISGVGQVSVVICGANGTKVVTLDSDGAPVNHAATCVHCSDCTTTAQFLLPALEMSAQHHFGVLHARQPAARSFRSTQADVHHARGPPSVIGV